MHQQKKSKVLSHAVKRLRAIGGVNVQKKTVPRQNGHGDETQIFIYIKDQDASVTSKIAQVVSHFSLKLTARGPEGSLIYTV